MHGKHDQHWSPPFKRNDHKLAEVQRRGMKMVRKDSWYQRRLGGAGFIRPGIPVVACNDQAKHVARCGLPCHPGPQGLQLSTTASTLRGLLGAMFYPEPRVRATGFA